ncbi:MAG TPA: dethiobiotin synthase [Verrucomicrobiae bacterium]|nr:dethiobiotin synthase [Verrucomicrobiae bacterium]
MSARTIFVTGTDTGVGKTRVARALIRQAREQGLRVCGFKPVATGCARTRDGLRNDDALALQEAAGTDEPYELINPVAFERAVAPHLAAAQAGRRIRIEHLDAAHRQLAARYDLIIAEGAGGWRVPLDEAWTLGAWVSEREWPVLLVVGMRLGCLNHALMSAEIIARETRLAGWIANVLPPAMDLLDENLATLQQRLSAPCWGRIDCGKEEFVSLAEMSDALSRAAGRP